jgi:hypothetical protein
MSSEEMARLKDVIADVRGWLAVKLTTGRCSFGLIMELAYHTIHRLYHVHAIYDEIGKLEGTDDRPSLTKPAAPFDREILRGLWHKHHFQPRFLAANLRLEILRPDKINSILEPYFGRYLDEVANEVIHAITFDAYEQRARDGRMTGEWIIFEKSERGNYYWTLGRHGDDENIKIRVETYRLVERELTSARQPN